MNEDCMMVDGLEGILADQIYKPIRSMDAERGPRRIFGKGRWPRDIPPQSHFCACARQKKHSPMTRMPWISSSPYRPTT